MDASDYYELLGLDRGASDADIKKAYRKLAVKWHPDKNPDDPATAEAMFKSIAEAYDVLSDPQKRASYDRYGKEGVAAGGGGGFGGGSFGGGGVHDFAAADEIFKRFFGGRDPFAAFGNDPFGDDFFQGRVSSGCGGGGGSGRGGGGGVRGGRSLFADSFFGGQLGGFGNDPFGDGGFGGGGFSSSTSFSSFGGGFGGGMTSSSTSMSTSIENGVRITRKTTTQSVNGQTTTTVEESRTHPDGSTETQCIQNNSTSAPSARLY